MHELRKQTVPTLGGRLEINVNVAGQGDPVVYLHSAGGFYWDDFLDSLADDHTVYAPYFPGTEPGVPDGIDQLDELWDAVLAYDDLLDGLGLESTKLIGHSFRRAARERARRATPLAYREARADRARRVVQRGRIRTHARTGAR